MVQAGPLTPQALIYSLSIAFFWESEQRVERHRTFLSLAVPGGSSRAECSQQKYLFIWNFFKFWEQYLPLVFGQLLTWCQYYFLNQSTARSTLICAWIRHSTWGFSQLLTVENGFEGVSEEAFLTSFHLLAHVGEEWPFHLLRSSCSCPRNSWSLDVKTDVSGVLHGSSTYLFFS